MPEIQPGLKRFLLAVRREYRFILASFAASGIGYIGSAAAPVMVNTLIDAGLNHRQAGDLGMTELTILALSSILITPYVPIISHRKLAVGGTLVHAVGLVISACSVAYPPMIVGRIFSGIGSGLAISGANAAVAAREDAERIFAIIWTMGGAITAFLAMYLPRVVAVGGYPLGFGALLGLALLALPCIFWLPPKPVARAQAAGGEAASTTAASAGSDADLKTAFGLPVLLTLAGMFVYSAAEQALWNFAYNIPIEAGVDPDLAAEIVAFTTIMGLAGGAIAAMLGVRLGRIFPIVIGSLFSVCGRWLYISSASATTLLIGSLLWGLGFYFVSPYQIGLVSAVDRKGRAAVASAAAFNFGYAAGPGMAGRILEYMDRDWLMVVITVSTLVAMLLMLPLAFKVDRSARREARAAAGRPAEIG